MLGGAGSAGRAVLQDTRSLNSTNTIFLNHLSICDFLPSAVPIFILLCS